MRLVCERCGTWVDEEFTHVVQGSCVCVLCAFQMEIPGWQEDDEPNYEVPF